MQRDRKPWNPSIIFGWALVLLIWGAVEMKARNDIATAAADTQAELTNLSVLFQQDVLRTANNLDRILKFLRRSYERNGITIIDDFGHHPTAIRETLAALRKKFGPARLWALFEPRSNTTRRAVFQDDLPKAFAEADGVFISQVARLEQLPEEDRLKPEKVVTDIASQGKPAFYEPTADRIIERLKPLVKTGDVVVVFSNGGFDGIHQKLLEKL